MLLLFHMLKSKQRPNLAVSLQLDFLRLYCTFLCPAYCHSHGGANAMIRCLTVANELALWCTDRFSQRLCLIPSPSRRNLPPAQKLTRQPC